jgi:hypothetical protein
MYSKMGEPGDDKLMERWQKDAERIVIFVSNLCLYFHPASSIKLIL